jgi:hypothetical protein
MSSVSTLVLRSIVLLMGVALAGWAIDLYLHGAGVGALIVMALEGVLIIVGVLFERSRYRPTITSPGDHWQISGEKFKDPTSGKTMQVAYDPKTGQRNYIEMPPVK